MPATTFHESRPPIASQAFADLETAGHPSLLVDERLHVHHCNAAASNALNRQHAPLTLDDGQLQLRSLEARRVRRSVAEVLRGARQRVGLKLPREGRAPVTALVAATAVQGLALIELRDPDDTQVDAQLLEDLFGLTPAEAGVAALLCLGLAPTDVARTRGVKVNTVSAHLKRALRKCDVGRQQQMVALLLRSVAACRPAPAPAAYPRHRPCWL